PRSPRFLDNLQLLIRRKLPPRFLRHRHSSMCRPLAGKREKCSFENQIRSAISAEPLQYFHNGHGTGYALSCHEDWVYVPEIDYCAQNPCDSACQPPLPSYGDPYAAP